MKIVGTKAVYLVLIWVLVVVLLGTVLYSGYRRNISDLHSLMENEAARLAGIVTVATAVGIDAHEDIEVMTAYRLLDNARYIGRLAKTGTLSGKELEAIASENELSDIAIYDSNSRIVSQTDTENDEQESSREIYRNAVENIIGSGGSGEFIGFDPSRFPEGTAHGVAVAGPSGGAVVVKSSYESILGNRRAPGLGTLGRLFRGLSEDSGVRYIVLQDTLGIIVASPNIGSMTRLRNDPVLLQAYSGGTASRIIEADGSDIFEVVSPFTMDGRKMGILRIGLGTDAVDDIRSSAVRHFTLLFLVSLFSGAFLILYVILRQNYTLLASEHDRILLEVKTMEEESRRAERLASLGHLAAGVAHEIRNPLNSISIIIQQLEEEVGTPENAAEHRDMLLSVGSEIDRIGTIIEHFLSYARPPDLDVTEFPVKKLIDIIRSSAERYADKKHVNVESVCESGLTCRCDFEQMRHALENMAVNAVDACAEGDTVTIRAEKNGTTMLFSVQDSGPGIEKDVLPRVFDPYFTTRDSGTGLGLSEAHRIAVAHGGRISAGNADSGGAVFTISLPCGKGQ